MGPRGHGASRGPDRGADYFAALAAHVAGREPEALVFTAVKGGALRAQGFQRTVLTETARLARHGGPAVHTRYATPRRRWRSRRART